MNQIELIADQLQRSYSGEAWHGPSVQELLTGVTAEKALARPLAAVASTASIAVTGPGKPGG